MSTSKSRKTEIVAHISKKRLQKLFPDMTTDSYLIVDEELFDEHGDPIENKHIFYGYSAKDQAMVALLERANVSYRIEKVKRHYDNYVRIEFGGSSRDLSIRSKSPRTTAIIFSSTKDEADHYADVDLIVAELAKKNVAVLRGECEITITTRC